MQKRPNDYSYFPSVGNFEQHLSSLPPCKSTTFLTLPETMGSFLTKIKPPLEIIEITLSLLLKFHLLFTLVSDDKLLRQVRQKSKMSMTHKATPFG